MRQILQKNVVATRAFLEGRGMLRFRQGGLMLPCLTALLLH